MTNGIAYDTIEFGRHCLGGIVGWSVIYYQKSNGEVPVLDFLLSLNTKLRAKAFSELELLQKHGPSLREPYVKAIKGDLYKGLYELRIRFSSDISRIFYFSAMNQTYVLLHGFIKKSEETPKRELERAKRYMMD